MRANTTACRRSGAGGEISLIGSRLRERVMVTIDGASRERREAEGLDQSLTKGTTRLAQKGATLARTT